MSQYISNDPSTKSAAFREAVLRAERYLTLLPVDLPDDDLERAAQELEEFMDQYRIEAGVKRDDRSFCVQDGWGLAFEKAKLNILEAELGGRGLEEAVRHAEAVYHSVSAIAEALPEKASTCSPELNLGWRGNFLMDLADERRRTLTNFDRL